MNFSRKLFCLLLVTLSLVTSTVWASCDPTSIYTCIQVMKALTPEQWNQKGPACKAFDDMMKCDQKYIQQCSMIPGVSELDKQLMGTYKPQYNDICGPLSSTSNCKDAFEILQCSRPLVTLSVTQMTDRKAVCKATYAGLDCEDAYFKRCPHFTWLTKEILDNGRERLDKGCPSALSETMAGFWAALTLSTWS